MDTGDLLKNWQQAYVDTMLSSNMSWKIGAQNTASHFNYKPQPWLD